MNEAAFKVKARVRMAQLELLVGQFPILSEAVRLMEEALRQQKKVLVFGNGGSATQSSHLAAELVNKFYFQRPGLPALSLTSDMANLTAIANDFDFKYIFSRQLETLGTAGDVALGITTGGTSANVLEAFKTAKTKGLPTIALCGKYTEPLQNLDIDVIISIQSTDTPVIQEMHLFVLHTMAEMLEKIFFGGNS